MLVAITGEKQSEKDTVAQYLETKGFKRFAFADRMREAIYKLNPWVCVSTKLMEFNYTSFYPKSSYYYTSEGCFIRLKDLVDGVGWDIAKEDPVGDVRGLLQRFGTECGRDIHGENCWIDLTFGDIYDADTKDIVISDCRFFNEALAVRDHSGSVWKIDRGLPKTETSSHSSEQGFDPQYIDITINNYWLDQGVRKDISFEDLYKTVDRVLDFVGWNNANL